MISLLCRRFLVGREKEGVESEVARLINESLEMDKTSRKVCFLKQELVLLRILHSLIALHCYCVYF